MKEALIVIDYTYDFIATDGKLTAGFLGQKIEEPIVQKINEFAKRGDFIVYAVDKHELSDTYHPECKLFPPHNLEGTKGRALYGKLQEQYQELKENEYVYWLDKRHYSAFSGTDLDIRLRERGITEITLVGVCTDICVLHTAVDAYNLGYSLSVPSRCVASFDEIGHTWALRHFVETLGARVEGVKKRC